MKITILCSSPDHPIQPFLKAWADNHNAQHDIRSVRTKAELPGGDLLFLISCSEHIGKPQRDLYRSVLVIHASDLPEGRGWSPHIWAICKGANEIVVSLLEAEEAIDSGKIWSKVRLPIAKTALWDEINEALFLAELKLMDFAVDNFATILPQAQSQEVLPTYLPRRRPQDSRIDPQRSIAEQFDLLRVSDPNRYPAFFEWHGKKFKIVLERADDT